MIDSLQIRAHPDASYSCDHAAQAAVTACAGRKTRRFHAALAVGIFSFVFGIVGVATHIPFVQWLGLSAFVTLLLTMIWLGISTPTAKCTSCNAIMKKSWIPALPGDRDLFLVCERCKKYVFAHQGSIKG